MRPLHAATFALSAFVVDAGAQVPDRRTVTGVVVDSARNPIPYVTVQVGSTRTVTTDSGRFAIRSVPGDAFKVTFMRIGFGRVDQLVPAGPDTSLSIVLTPVAVQLSTIDVFVASSAKLELRGFYDRMRDVERGINRGYFVTPEDLERRRPPFITQMFEGFPSVRVYRYPPMTEYQAEVRGTGNCKMTVYLDGIRVIGKVNPRSEDLINVLVKPSEIAGAEIYPRGIGAPPQYQELNGSCGIVLIWTK